MKKKQIVEVDCVKKATSMIITVIALIIGFALGIGYSSFDKKEPKQRKAAIQDNTRQQEQVNIPHDHSNDEKYAMIKKLEQMVEVDPKNKDTWVLLGNAYYGLNMNEKSIAAYKKYIELDPDDPNVWTDMGTMYRRLKNPEQAIVSYKNALKIDPKHEMTYINMGIVLYWDLKDIKGAVKTWGDLLKINPNAKLPDGQPIRKLLEDLNK